MNTNDTIPRQIDLFEPISSENPTDLFDPGKSDSEPVSVTARSAIRRMVRTLATAKNYRKTAAMNAAIQAKNAAAFFKAWDFLRSECCKNDNKNGGLVHGTQRIIATDPMAEQDHE